MIENERESVVEGRRAHGKRQPTPAESRSASSPRPFHLALIISTSSAVYPSFLSAYLLSSLPYASYRLPSSFSSSPGARLTMAALHHHPSTPERDFTFADASAVYKLADEDSPLGGKVKDALGVIEKAIADYG